MDSADLDETASLRRMPDGYVDGVRVSWERTLEREALAILKSSGVAPYDDQPEAGSDLIPLTPALAPRVLRLAGEVSGALAVDEPLRFVQTRGLRRDINGSARILEKPYAVELIGPVATFLGDGPLRSMLGHEIGHLSAHSPARSGAWLILSSSSQLRRVSPHLPSLYSVAAELTADRIGLLACQDLNHAIELEVALHTGESPDALQLAVDEYVEECRKRSEEPSEPLWNLTHPSHAFRVFAMWMFWRSDVYRQLTGTGPADVLIDDLDELLHRMVKSSPRPALPRLPSKPPPREGMVRATDAMIRAAEFAGQHAERLLGPKSIRLFDSPLNKPAARAQALADWESVLAAGKGARSRDLHTPPTIAGDDVGEGDLFEDDLERKFRELEARLQSGNGKPA